MGGKFHPKLNICGRPIANKYREGKMKRTLKRESKVLEIAEIEGMASSIGRGIWPARPWARRVRNWLLPLRACRRRRPSRSCPPASVRMDSRWSRRGLGKVAVLSGADLTARAERDRRGLRCENHSACRGRLGAPCNGRPVPAGCNASRRRPVAIMRGRLTVVCLGS